jgi:hypothetical protein
MAETKQLKFGDPSPASGQPFVPALVPTDEEYARLGDRENPVVLSKYHDTATREFRKEHGALYFDPLTGYKTRFPLKDIEAANAKPAERVRRQPAAAQGQATEPEGDRP